MNYLHISEVLRQITNMIKSLVTHNKALKTQISQLEHNPLVPFTKGRVNVVIEESGKQVESSREKNREVEENSDEENVGIKESPPTPPKNDVIEEVEKESPYVLNLPTSH